MKFIAHRGNISGVDLVVENSEKIIQQALDKNYDVEIDVWVVGKTFFLGHDYPQYEIDRTFLLFNSKKLWCHAKNLKALESMLSLGILNCFWHQEDDYTITSKGFIWAYPNKDLTKNSVAVLKKDHKYSLEALKMCYGICSDNIQEIKKILMETK